jgi:hypothetical protein
VFWLWLIKRKQPSDEEKWLSKTVEHSNWHVRFCGDRFCPIGFSPCWTTIFSYFSSRCKYGRPFLTKETEDLSAWLFEHQPFCSVVIAIKNKRATYPHIALRNRNRVVFGSHMFEFCRPKRRSFVKRYPRLARQWDIRIRGSWDQAEAMLLRLAKLSSVPQELFSVEMMNDYLVITSGDLSWRQHALLRFAADASAILDAIGVSDLFAGVPFEKEHAPLEPLPRTENGPGESGGQNRQGVADERAGRERASDPSRP